MDFSEDFHAIQGALASCHNTTGDFLLIKHRGGNEQKINRIADDLRTVLVNKKYLKRGKINEKYEQKLREINLFLILNTEFNNKEILTNDVKLAHLIDVTPKLSKCLLANLVWSLDLQRFYAETVFSLPIQLSVELMEPVCSIVKKAEPYAVLEHTAMIALAIYVKLYLIRNECCNEETVNVCISKLIERFTEILQNYITPDSRKMESWPTSEMYEYMGAAIQRILNLLKSCFRIFLENSPNQLHEMYQIDVTGPAYSAERLDKSGQALIKLNVCLMSVCEANLGAVTVDAFCAWAEYKHNNIVLQQTIGALAYDVRQQLEHFEGCGNLPDMLEGIMKKPKSVDEQISEADEKTLLQNVVIADKDQVKWFKALLHHGIMKNETVFNTFKTVVHLCSKDDFAYLLEYSTPYIKDYKELKNMILLHIAKFDDVTLINIIAEYFQKSSVSNLYEQDNFDTKMSGLLNRLTSDSNVMIPMKEIGSLVLQNPVKFITQLLKESMKNNEHISIIYKILHFIKPICKITDEGHFKSKYTLLTELVLKFLKENELDENDIRYFSVFVFGLLSKNNIEDTISTNVPEELLSIVEFFIERNRLKQAITILRIMQELPLTIFKTFDSGPVVVRFCDILSKMRWTFFTYSEDKSDIVTECVQLLRTIASTVNSDTLNPAKENLKEDPIDLFYVNKMQANEFLSVVSSGFNSKANHNELVCRLLKVLPSCTREEWIYTIRCFEKETQPLKLLQLYLDVILILTEIAKSSQCQGSLSYCFQQFCVLVKTFIYPQISKDKEQTKIFIKKMCKLITHLPQELQNKNDVPLANIFDGDVLKSMADDEEFMHTLTTISHLEISRIICSKLI